MFSCRTASRSEEIALLRIEGEQILKADRQEVWREKTGAPRTAFAAHTFSEVFRLLVSHPRLVGPLKQYFSEDVYVHQFKLNAKAAFEGDVWQWHQDYGTWARDDGMPQPRAMNIAVFLDEVMPINGPLLLIPGSHKQGVFEAGHDKLTTSYPLWTLDKETVTRLCRDAETAHGQGIVGANRQARLGADVPRQPGARLAAQHHALPAQDRLRDVLRLLQPHHQVHPRGMDRAPRLHADSAGGDGALLEYARAHRVAAE
jgi:ectoine hydroxylase